MKKILLVNKEESGSKYHRITIPFTLLKQKFPEEYEITFYYEKYLTEELVKNYNIVVFHWTQLTRCEHLSLWRDKYGFKIIQDVDDYWELPLDHPVKANMDKSKGQLINQLILSDGIICSTIELSEKVKYFNDNILLRQNFLPMNNPNFPQFQVNIRDFYKSKKINVGICGSISHLPDWLEITKELKELKNDKFIQDNVNFVVSGISNKNESSKAIWRRVSNLFIYGVKNKKKRFDTINPIIVESNPPTDYMKNYLPIDILLCPLVDNEYNNCKSNLKILESGLNGSLAIGNNDMYLNKINQNFFINSSNLKNTIMELVKMWKYNPINFTEMCQNIQTNLLNYNYNLENEEINKLNEFLKEM